MIRFLTLLAVSAVATVALAADNEAFQAAMTRLPDPAPAPAFADTPEVAMPAFCAAVPELERYYPTRALRRGREGIVVLDCAFAADGKPSTCQVLFEEPLRYEFGEAALRIACHFQVNVPSFDSGTPMSNLPVDARYYRRNADGEPWHTRTPVRFQFN